MVNIKNTLLALLVLTSFVLGQTYDPPAGYTNQFSDGQRLKLYDNDDWPSADSLNDDKNIIADAFRKSEFEIGITKVDVINGAFIISSGMKVDEIVSGTFPATTVIKFIDVSDKNTAFFAVNDVIMAKAYNNDGTLDLFWVGIVTNVSGLNVTIDKDATMGTPTGTAENGDVFVRIGSTSDTQRQSSILLQSDVLGWNRPPKILFKNNVTSYEEWTDESKTYTLIGNMQGEYGYLADVAGVGIGSYNDDKVNFVVDTIDGFQVRRKDLVVSQWENDGKITVGRVDNDFNNVTIDTTDGIRLNKGGSAIAKLGFDGKLTLGENASGKDRIEILGTDAINFYYNDGSDHVNLRIDSDSIIFGENANGKFRTEIEADRLAQYYKTSGGTDYRLFDLSHTTGNPYLILGTDANDFYRTEIKSTGLQQIYNNSGADEIWTNLTLGNLTLGIPANENIQLTPTSLSFYDNSVVYGSLSGTNWTLGRTTTENLYITPTSLTFRDNGTTLGSLTSSLWTIGETANSRARVEISTAGISQIYKNSGGTDLTYLLTNAAGLQVGLTTTENIFVDNTALTFRDNGTIYGSLSSTNWTLGNTTTENVYITPTALSFRDNGTTLGSLSANKWTIGQDANSKSRAEISPTSMDFYYKTSGGLDRNWLSIGTTNVRVGRDANTTFRSVIDASSFSIFYKDGSAVDHEVISIDGTPNVTIGEVANNQSRVEIGSNGIELIHRNGSAVDDTKISLDNSGNAFFDGSITLSSGQSVKSGQTDYNTGTGFWLGSDSGTPKFSIGSSGGNALTWDGTNLAVNGGIITNVGGGTELSIQGWSHNMRFSSTDHNTVAWSGGSVRLLDGTSYTISSGNTGNISAPTYILLDIAVSTTALTTTTSSTAAVGSGRILIGSCEDIPNTETDYLTKDAVFIIFGGDGLGGSGKLITADNIVANTITANEIAANTVTANEMNVSTLSAITADMGTITAGSITSALYRTAASGQRVEINETGFGNEITFFNSSNYRARLYATTGTGIIPKLKLSSEFQVDNAVDMSSTLDVVGQITGSQIESLNDVVSGDDVVLDEQLQIATGTTSAQGILWGSDVNLYRTSANNLKTDDNFTVGGNLTVTGTFSPSSVSTGVIEGTSIDVSGNSDANTFRINGVDVINNLGSIVNVVSATVSGGVTGSDITATSEVFTNTLRPYTINEEYFNVKSRHVSATGFTLSDSTGTVSGGFRAGGGTIGLVDDDLEWAYAHVTDVEHTWTIDGTETMVLEPEGLTVFQKEIKVTPNAVASGTTVDVATKTFIELNYSASSTITNFTNGEIGQRLIITNKGGGGFPTIQDNANIFLAGSANFVVGLNDVIELIKNTNGWAEITRSNN